MTGSPRCRRHLGVVAPLNRFGLAPSPAGLADGPLADAQAFLQVGALDQAAAILSGGFSLGHGLLQAQVHAREEISPAH